MAVCKREPISNPRAHSVGFTAASEALAVRLLATACRHPGVSLPSAAQHELLGVSSGPLVQHVPSAVRKAASQSGSGCSAGALAPPSAACGQGQRGGARVAAGRRRAGRGQWVAARALLGSRPLSVFRRARQPLTWTRGASKRAAGPRCASALLAARNSEQQITSSPCGMRSEGSGWRRWSQLPAILVGRQSRGPESLRRDGEIDKTNIKLEQHMMALRVA